MLCNITLLLQDNHYVPFIRADQHVDVHPQHLCTTKKEVYIHCVDEFGKSKVLAIRLT